MVKIFSANEINVLIIFRKNDHQLEMDENYLKLFSNNYQLSVYILLLFI